MSAENYKDEWIDKAFRLAFFIHGERETAKKITINALNKLETASNAQFKRYYYTPTGRAENSRAQRNRVSLSDLQLLQRLVFVESENFEREKETNEKTLVKFFIKHLVRISLKRNSFYVTLGISRILHNYTTNDAMEIYNVIVQDPERVHDDYYFRSRKGVLMRELKERFGDLLETVKVNRGEERFDQKKSDEDLLAAAKEALNTFTPWNSICAIPEEFDPFDDTIKSFYFDKEDPDEEHRIEINRIHAALHPECFERLTDSLNLPPSEQKMEIPKFMITENYTEKDDHWQNPPNLEADEMREIKDILNAQAESRKALTANFLRIIVDGAPKAEINLSKTGKVNFDLDETAELIEVCAAKNEGDLILATHLLSFDELKKDNVQSVILENGKKISFDLKPAFDARGEIIGVNCGIEYTKGEQNIPAVSIQKSADFSFANLLENLGWSFKPAAAFGVILLMFFFGWLIYKNLEENKDVVITPNSTNQNNQIPDFQPENNNENLKEKEFAAESESPKKPDRQKNSAAHDTKIKSPKKKRSKPKSQTKPRKETTVKSPPRELRAAKENQKIEESDPDKDGILRLPIRETDIFPEGNVTRKGNLTKNPGKTLNQVKQIFIEISGDKILGGQISRKIYSEIQTSERFSVTMDKEIADAALKIYARRKGDGSEGEIVSAIIRLVNSEGFVIYPNRKGISGWKYVGKLEKISVRIAKDLHTAK